MAKQYIDAIAAERLLRDLEATASATLRRVVADAKDHIWLLDRIATVDVTARCRIPAPVVPSRRHARQAQDAPRRPVRHPRRVPAERQSRTYPELLTKISELTGQVEKSVASEILALLEPDQPTIDREVRELLPRYGFYPLPESPLFDECVAYHRELREVMMLVLELPAFGRLEARFDQADRAGKRVAVAAAQVQPAAERLLSHGRPDAEPGSGAGRACRAGSAWRRSRWPRRSVRSAPVRACACTSAADAAGDGGAGTPR